MAYEPNTWGTYEWDDNLSREENLQNARESNALVTQEKLMTIESGIDDAHTDIAEIELTPGPQGEPGVDGEQGLQGEPGADGYPSEQEWNALIARVEALETEE